MDIYAKYMNLNEPRCLGCNVNSRFRNYLLMVLLVED